MNTLIATDFELLRKYQAGSESAFGDLVSRHIDWVYSSARRRLNDSHLAEDVTQAVFMALAQNRRLDERTIMSRWLFGVLRYTSAKAIREQSRRRRRERIAAEQRPMIEMASHETWSSDLAPHLEDAVDMLRQRDREAVLLRFYQCCSFAEVGDALGISEESARKRVTRAVEKLRRYFAAQGVTTPITSIAAEMLEHCTQAAPGTLGASIRTGFTASKGGSQLSRAWLRHTQLRILMPFVVLAGAALIAILTTIAVRNPTTKSAPLAAANFPVTQPALDSNPTTHPTSITFDQIIAGVKKSETEFQNLHIKNFETTVETRPEGQANWDSTPMIYTGSAWYEADPRGRQRIYFSDMVDPWEKGAAPWAEQIKDVSWDGKQLLELRLASGSLGKMIRMRTAMITADDPAKTVGFSLNPFTRYMTGVAFTPQYLVDDEDLSYPLKPRRLFSNFLEAVHSSPRIVQEISVQKMNGFDTVRLRFTFPLGSITNWFDQSRGFSLIKQENILNQGNSTRIEGVDIDEFKTVGPGIWFPIHASVVREGGLAIYQRYNFRAEDVIANDPNFDPVIFQAAIPTGWVVSDDRTTTRRSYVTMEDGTEQEIVKGSIMPHIKAGIATRPDGDDPPIATSPRAAW
jgi:RNA polymerase sigma factor (sigma-70 family)